MNRAIVLQAGIVICLLGLFAASFCEEDTKEMRIMKLRLQQASLALQETEGELARADAHFLESQKLFQKGLCSKLELADAEEMYNRAALAKDQAAIELEKTRLAFLNDALHVTLEKAAMYRDGQGYKHAQLTLKNSSNIRRILDEKGAYSEGEKRGLLTIENLTVRLLFQGSLVGRPFEYRIPSLAYNQARTVDFVLQKETEEVTVTIAYGDTVLQLPVFLEKEAKEDRVQMDAAQFSQEGALGTRISYDLELERFVDDDKAFSIEVLNLPGDYSYEFQELNADPSQPAGGSDERRVSKIRFRKGTTTKTIRMFINMPKEIRKDALNEKVAFFVLVLDRFSQQRLAALKARSQGRALQGDDLDSAGVSYEALELVPRGRAEITINAAILSHKVNLRDPITFSFNLQNTGTVNLDRIRVYLTSLPVDWTANVKPEKDISLAVEAQQKVDVELVPSAEVVAGDYDVKVEARTLHEGRQVEAAAKQMRIQIEGKSNFLVGAVLMVALIAMIVGVAVMTIKISRR